jgi:hypothetical protein
MTVTLTVTLSFAHCPLHGHCRLDVEREGGGPTHPSVLVVRFSHRVASQSTTEHHSRGMIRDRHAFEQGP